MSKRIAIIGAGIAGLTAAYLLNRKHDIALYEKEDHLGGNAHTLHTSDGIEFDIAVAVFGKKNYPNFNKLLKELNVEMYGATDGGASMRNLDTGKEAHLSPTLKGMIAQRFAMFYPWNLARLKCPTIPEGMKFYEAGKLDGLTMAEALAILPPSRRDSLMMRIFVLCLVSSMYYDDVMAAPASFFFGKMVAHREFFTKTKGAFFHPEGNTRSYVNALVAHFKPKILLNARIARIARSETGVLVKMDGGDEAQFDQIVFACNADQVLKLLEKPTDEEEKILGAWRYQDGPIVVHKDRSSFPKREHYSMFTFLYTDRGGKIHTSVNGHVRSLRTVPDDCRYISSQHPNFPIDENRIEYRKVFRTPIYDAKSVQTIRDLPSLNGKMNTYYCGSHFGYGLHEDAVSSAAAVAADLGVQW
ncbi:MAG: FAD-dependent oxidoreductase [Proteobacteria bacterium]|nr:FAD-dependent oxidoreductase [Pseudomonadota bacterium]